MRHWILDIRCFKCNKNDIPQSKRSFVKTRSPSYRKTTLHFKWFPANNSGSYIQSCKSFGIPFHLPLTHEQHHPQPIGFPWSYALNNTVAECLGIRDH